MPNDSIFSNTLVLIKGAGDLASGVAYCLKQSGFPVVMTELPVPMFVRRAVCFGEAVYSHHIEVEGIEARLVDSPNEARLLARSQRIPLLIDPQARAVMSLNPQVVVDAIMAKQNTDTSIHDAPQVIALGPGFRTGEDCHAVIETKRGHRLGRVIHQGSAASNTGSPGEVKGYTMDRVLRAPAEGHVHAVAHIGNRVVQGQLLATVGRHEIRAPFDGVLRGLIHSKVLVTPGLKIGDLDPRGQTEHCFTISDKSLSIGSGVLRAILANLTAN